MSPFRRKPEKYERKRERALSNPIRQTIVELFTADESRPLTAKAVAVDLRRSAAVSVGQVGYHLACLRDAELIPGVKAEGR